MVCSINSITSTIKQIPSQALKGIDKLGEATCNGVNFTKDAIKSHTPDNVKQTVKDTFTKASDLVKNNKNKAVGIAVLLGATASAIKIATGLRHKIKNADQN